MSGPWGQGWGPGDEVRAHQVFRGDLLSLTGAPEQPAQTWGGQDQVKGHSCLGKCQPK